MNIYERIYTLLTEGSGGMRRAYRKYHGGVIGKISNANSRRALRGKTGATVIGGKRLSGEVKPNPEKNEPTSDDAKKYQRAVKIGHRKTYTPYGNNFTK